MNPRDEIAASGEIDASTPDKVLQWCEARRFTGTLRFTDGDDVVEVPMLGGLPEVHDADDPVARSVRRFGGLNRGTYTLAQALPPIEGAADVSEFEREGSLADYTAGVLMQYAEVTGLTGELVFRQDAPEPRSFRAIYERGELVSITCDESTQDAADVTTIFTWREGSWSLRATPLFADGANGAPPAPPRRDTPLLRTVEVALAEILTQRDASRGASWKPPSFRPANGEAPGDIIPRAPKVPRATGGADTTVKVYFVQARRTPDTEPPARSEAPPPAAPAPREVTAPPPPDANAPASAARPPASRAELLLWAILAVCALIALVSIVELVARS